MPALLMKKLRRLAKGALSLVIKNKSIEFHGLSIAGAFQDFGLLNEMSKGNREPFMTEVFLGCVSRCHGFWDVGAHLGVYSLLAAARSEGSILALEPNPRTFQFLLRNVENNGFKKRILPLSFAVSDKAERLTFFCDELESDVSSLVQLENPGQLRSFDVETKTLDQLAAETLAYPQIMKVDVEGAELSVLRGGAKFWERVKAQGPFHLFIESNAGSLERAGSSAQELVQELKKLGFAVSIIDEVGKSLIPVDERVNSGCWNLYCTL